MNWAKSSPRFCLAILKDSHYFTMCVQQRANSRSNIAIENTHAIIPDIMGLTSEKKNK